jgi:hypothetical protein
MHISTEDKKLFNLIIDSKSNDNCDELIIISGYLGPEPIIQLAKKDIDSKIFYGMANESLNPKFHEKLKDLDNEYSNLEIFYSGVTCHSKIYTWKKDNKIINALLGSANFSSNSLLKINRETLIDVNEKDYNQLNEYINLIENSSNRCFDYSMTNNTIKKDKTLDLNIFISSSLFAPGSKINWGHAPNAHVNNRDSYIPIRIKDIHNYPHFFPKKISNAGLGNADNDPIDVLWDDGEVMLCLLEGNNTIDGKRYPNKIASKYSKKIIIDHDKTSNILDTIGGENISCRIGIGRSHQAVFCGNTVVTVVHD